MANRDRDSFDDYDTDDQDDGFLTFDAREEEEDRSRGPLIIVGIVAVLALIGVVFWQVYQSSREPGETPQVAADSGSFKAPGDLSATSPVVGSDLDKGVFDAASGASAPALEVQPTIPAEAPMLTDGSAAPAAVAPALAPAVVAPPRQVAAATTKPAATTAGFSFGAAASTPASTTGFSFGGGSAPAPVAGDAKAPAAAGELVVALFH